MTHAERWTALSNKLRVSEGMLVTSRSESRPKVTEYQHMLQLL